MSRFALSLAAVLALGAAALTTACQSSSETDDAEEGALRKRESASLFRPGNRFAGWGGEHDRYLDDVQPLLGKRCVTCHGCSSSPCQLKLSGSGLRRVVARFSVTNPLVQRYLNLPFCGDQVVLALTLHQAT